eukprot:174_1
MAIETSSADYAKFAPTLSIPFNNINTNEKSEKHFFLKPYEPKYDAKRYNKYCHQFKKHISDILLHICKKRVVTDPDRINHVYKRFIRENDYIFMVRLNDDILSSIISYFEYHLNKIHILDKYKILNTLYLYLVPFGCTLFEPAYRSLISFVISPYMSKLWLNMLYLLLENGANPLLPQEQLIYVTHDINKLKKYVWCFDKGIVDN